MRILGCGSAYGAGGIGQHFAQLVEETRREDQLQCYYATRPRRADAKGRRISRRLAKWMGRYTPLRYSRSWVTHVENEYVDYKIAARLKEEPAEQYMGFVGKSLRSFRSASRLGFETLELVVANSHVDNLKRLHEQARRDTGIADTWLNEAQRRKTLREYEAADLIYVHSDYVRDTFIEAGVPERKLRRTHLHVRSRYTPPAQRPEDDVFRVVYVGRVEATKGIPLLIEAFSALDLPRAELTLVGGWSTRTMRRYMEDAMARDPRIRVQPGDPLPHLHRADVYVHPTYEDGFSYAAVEALASGVPVVVTEDTGMKEHVREGENGYVVPTGSWEVLRERMEHLRRHPLARTSAEAPLLHPSYAAGQRANDAVPNA